MNGTLVRPMRDDEADRVADMVRQLAEDIGSPTVPKVAGQQLRSLSGGEVPLLTVLVAEAVGDRVAASLPSGRHVEAGELVGAVLGLTTFSTWRGSSGFYVVDLFVDARHRGGRIGERLVAALAAKALELGHEFLKLEVEASNPGAIRFYRRLGFHHVEADTLHALERDGVVRLANQRAP